MKRIVLFFAFVLVAGVVSISAQIGKKIIGNNKYISIFHQVESYNKLLVSHVKSNVVYINHPDSAGFVRIYGEENIVHLLDVSVSKQTLSIKKINMANIENGLLMIYVYSPAIHTVDLTGGVIFETNEQVKQSEMKLAISGDAQIKISNLECDKLKVSLLGGGDLYVKGIAKEASYSVVGSGEVRADNLQAQTASAKLTGNGNIGCNVTKLLKSTIMGVGNIYYKGKPEVKSTILGTGNLKALE